MKKRCTMPDCPDFPVSGNRWCHFHIEEFKQEMLAAALNAEREKP